MQLPLRAWGVDLGGTVNGARSEGPSSSSFLPPANMNYAPDSTRPRHAHGTQNTNYSIPPPEQNSSGGYVLGISASLLFSNGYPPPPRPPSSVPGHVWSDIDGRIYVTIDVPLSQIPMNNTKTHVEVATPAFATTTHAAANLAVASIPLQQPMQPNTRTSLNHATTTSINPLPLHQRITTTHNAPPGTHAQSVAVMTASGPANAEIQGKLSVPLTTLTGAKGADITRALHAVPTTGVVGNQKYVLYNPAPRAAVAMEHVRNSRSRVAGPGEVRLKPHQCKVCGKRFSKHAGVKRHMRSHTGERPFKCNMCDKAFRQSAHLTAHKRSKHSKHSAERSTSIERGRKFRRLLRMNTGSAAGEK